MSRRKRKREIKKDIQHVAKASSTATVQTGHWL